jgi:hypothetical protein
MHARLLPHLLAMFPLVALFQLPVSPSVAADGVIKCTRLAHKGYCASTYEPISVTAGSFGQATITAGATQCGPVSFRVFNSNGNPNPMFVTQQLRRGQSASFNLRGYRQWTVTIAAVPYGLQVCQGKSVPVRFTVYPCIWNGDGRLLGSCVDPKQLPDADVDGTSTPMSKFTALPPYIWP